VDSLKNSFVKIMKLMCDGALYGIVVVSENIVVP
jgi:hypothetical protein